MRNYLEIFVDNISRLMKERNLNKRDLARLSGISSATLTTLLNGKTANPSLEIMQGIAKGFAIPLPLMLKPLESEEWQSALAVARSRKEAAEQSLLPGYAIVDVTVLTEAQVAEVNRWSKDIQAKLNNISSRSDQS